MDWTRFRAAVPAAEQVTYLNTGWSGPLCTPAHDAIREQLELEYQGGPTTPPVHEAAREEPRRARAAIARLIGATSETVALTQGTAHAVNIVFSGLSFVLGQHVVITDAEHTALSVPAAYARRRHGLGLRVVRIDETATEDELIADFDQAITTNSRLVAISHVLFNVGVRLPVRRIAEIARARGALVLLDGAQAAGQFPVDVRTLGADFYTVSGHKWLLGPTGVGGLYIHPDLIERVDAVMVARSATRGFDALGNLEPRRDAVEKFDLTETSAPLWAGLTAAIGFVDMAGLSAVEARVRELAARLHAGLAAIPGVKPLCPPPGPTATGLILFSVEGMTPDEVTHALWERGGVVGSSVFGRAATRLTVHAFNTAEDVDHAVALVAELARQASPGKARTPMADS